MNTRSQVLDEAKKLINGPREDHYGSPESNFGSTAKMWSAYLGYAVSPRDVCNMMALLKLSRLRRGPHTDSSVDAAGYLALGAEVAEVRNES